MLTTLLATLALGIGGAPYYAKGPSGFWAVWTVPFLLVAVTLLVLGRSTIASNQVRFYAKFSRSQRNWTRAVLCLSATTLVVGLWTLHCNYLVPVKVYQPAPVQLRVNNSPMAKLRAVNAPKELKVLVVSKPLLSRFSRTGLVDQVLEEARWVESEHEIDAVFLAADPSGLYDSGVPEFDRLIHGLNNIFPKAVKFGFAGTHDFAENRAPIEDIYTHRQWRNYKVGEWSLDLEGVAILMGPGDYEHVANSGLGPTPELWESAALKKMPPEATNLPKIVWWNDPSRLTPQFKSQFDLILSAFSGLPWDRRSSMQKGANGSMTTWIGLPPVGSAFAIDGIGIFPGMLQAPRITLLKLRLN